MPAIEPEDRYPAVPRLRTTSVVWKRYVALSDGAIDDGVRITGIARFRAADSRHLSLERRCRDHPSGPCCTASNLSERKAAAFLEEDLRVRWDRVCRSGSCPTAASHTCPSVHSPLGRSRERVRRRPASSFVEARPLRRGATPSCSAPTGHTIAGVTRGPARLAARFAPSARQAVMLARTPPGTRGPARGPRSTLSRTSRHRRGEASQPCCHAGCRPNRRPGPSLGVTGADSTNPKCGQLDWSANGVIRRSTNSLRESRIARRTGPPPA